MDVAQYKRQYEDLTWKLHREGYVDGNFRQLQQFEENTPGFLFDTMTLYFRNTENTINEINKLLRQESVDFDQISSHLIKLKGSTASVGAQRLNDICTSVQNHCWNNSKEGCLMHIQQFKQEMFALIDKLTSLFQLAHLIHVLGGKA